ncbi:MAG: phosphoglycolate phosphatase [Rhodomicrobium sp.]|nr:MAG: phosphoglycolate phosphatase [Rhodomicrobium sp.]
MPETPVTICFDLDGTLVNTAPDLLAALDHTLKANGHQPSIHAEILPIIGQGAKAMLRRALKIDTRSNQHGSVPAPDTEIDRLWQSLIEHYTIHIADQSRPYPGVEAALSRLSSANYRLAVCTNKPMFLTSPLLEALGLNGFFHAIRGADSYPFKKPDPRHLIETVRSAGGHENKAVLIGDSATDVATGRAATIPVIGVPFGYTETPMQSLAPDALISHFDELTDKLICEIL